VLWLVVFLLAACAPTPTARETSIPILPTSTPTSVPSPNTLTIALTAPIGALEFPHAAETNSQNAARAIFDSLIFQASDGSFEPALAKQWLVSDDGTTYTFFLRDDVTFHNGEPFNADAVVFTWKTYRDARVPHATFFTPAESVEKVDVYTVKVTTREPNALMLSYIALAWMPIPPAYYQRVGAPIFAEHPIGTGAFMFDEWVKKDRLTLRANKNYWREGFPFVDQVVFKFIPESAARVAALKDGTVDIAPRLSAEEARAAQSSSDVRIIRYPVDRVYYVAFNNVGEKPTPLADRRVRLALNYAVDRRGIVKGLLDNSAQLASGFIAPFDLGWDNAEPFAYVPERARQLLADAGYADGFEIEMACPNRAYSHINEVCEAIVRYLDQVNVRVNLELIESSRFWELEEQKQLPPLFADSWAAYGGEAFNRLEGALTRDAKFAAWHDPKFENLIRQIGRTLDRDERAALYRRLAQMMRDDPPFIYLYYPETFEGVSARVQNYAPRSAEDYYLWNVSIIK